MIFSSAATIKRLGTVLCLSIALTGCLAQQPSGDLVEAPRDIAAAAPQPASELQPYYLQIGDVMDIKLTLNPELNDQVVVRPDGMISTALVQDVPAYGRTVSELQDDLTKRYNKHLVNPQMSIIVRSVAPTRIYVTGEVNNSGEFISVGPTLTLVQAIARAGGVKNSAGTDKVVILRRGAGNKPQAYYANYTLAVSGSDPMSDVRLAPYDVVYVPRSGIGNVYLHFQQYVQQFIPVSFGVSYVANGNDN